MNAQAGAPGEIAVRIDRLVVEVEHPVDATALRRALVDALRAVIIERGVPQAWSQHARRPYAVIQDLSWDGRDAEPGLARVLAARLYEEALAPGALP